jgi:hypothetical protein
VTNLSADGFPGEGDTTRFEPARRDEEFYGVRGEMENVLKPPGFDLEADRMSTPYLVSHQLRRWRATRSSVFFCQSPADPPLSASFTTW